MGGDDLAAHVLGRAGELPQKTALSVLVRGAVEHWSYADLEAAVRGTGVGAARSSADFMALRANPALRDYLPDWIASIIGPGGALASQIKQKAEADGDDSGE